MFAVDDDIVAEQNSTNRNLRSAFPPSGWKGIISEASCDVFHVGTKSRMTLTVDQIRAKALATLAPEQRESSAIYLDEAEVKAGSMIEIDRKPIQVPFDSVIVFVDMQPQSNWGHPCRYLLFDRQSDAREVIDASFPPFLRAPSKTLRLIWKGETVPDWALAVRS